MFSNNLETELQCNFVIAKIALVLQNKLYYIYRLTSIQAQGKLMD